MFMRLLRYLRLRLKFGEIEHPALILSINFRETVTIINKLVEDTSLNIYSELIYENPACGKGSRCQYKERIQSFRKRNCICGVDYIDPLITATEI